MVIQQNLFNRFHPRIELLWYLFLYHFFENDLIDQCISEFSFLFHLFFSYYFSKSLDYFSFKVSMTSDNVSPSTLVFIFFKIALDMEVLLCTSILTWELVYQYFLEAGCYYNWDCIGSISQTVDKWHLSNIESSELWTLFIYLFRSF